MIVTLCVARQFCLSTVIGRSIRPDRASAAAPALLHLGSRNGIPAALYWLTAEPSFLRLLLVELWFSVIFGGYNGAMVVFLTEIMPVHVRTAGFSLAYSLATGIFGGFTSRPSPRT